MIVILTLNLGEADWPIYHIEHKEENREGPDQDVIVVSQLVAVPVVQGGSVCCMVSLKYLIIEIRSHTHKTIIVAVTVNYLTAHYHLD